KGSGPHKGVGPAQRGRARTKGSGPLSRTRFLNARTIVNSLRGWKTGVALNLPSCRGINGVRSRCFPRSLGDEERFCCTQEAVASSRPPGRAARSRSRPARRGAERPASLFGVGSWPPLGRATRLLRQPVVRAGRSRGGEESIPPSRPLTQENEADSHR